MVDEAKVDKALNRTIGCLSVNMSVSVDISDHINYSFYLFKFPVNEFFLLRGLHESIKLYSMCVLTAF